jgi:4-carboxymuconolactone decarboxylase
MPRIDLPTPEQMTPEQLAVYEKVVEGPRGRMIGPLRAVIHSPDLAERWSKLGEFLRYSTCLPRKLNELAIIVTGRRWNSQVEFHVHVEAARTAGLDPAVIEAIRLGKAPSFAEQEDYEIYEFTRHLHQTGTVPETIYHAVEQRWGARGVVELTAVIGYYTMVSMTLNVHEIPLMEDVEPPLAPVAGAGSGLTPLPQARLSAMVLA